MCSCVVKVINNLIFIKLLTAPNRINDYKTRFFAVDMQFNTLNTCIILHIKTKKYAASDLRAARWDHIRQLTDGSSRASATKEKEIVRNDSFLFCYS